MIRTAFQRKSAAAIILVALGIAMTSSAAPVDQQPSPELLQYIRDAKGRGVTEARIKQQAVAIGWPVKQVDEALSYEKSGKGLKDEPAAAVERQPVIQPAQSPKQQAAPNQDGLMTADDNYQIGAGDVLQISVWKEPDVAVPSVVVRPDGRITVPLIKEVEVRGLTPHQAEKKIAEGLSKFITDANVTVVVTSINSKKVYVIGAVRKEGTLPCTYGMSVLQALSEAGGLTDYAKRRKIYIIRTEGGREYRLDFNYDEVVKGERMEQNIVLQPGDTVVIPH